MTLNQKILQFIQQIKAFTSSKTKRTFYTNLFTDFSKLNNMHCYAHANLIELN